MASTSSDLVNSCEGSSFAVGEVVPPLELGKSTSIAAKFAGRAERFRLQAIASQILPDGHRTRSCFHVPVSGKIEARLTFKAVAYLDGLCLCGKVWVCPVCLHQIMSRRRLEVIQVNKVARGRGQHVAMVTWTYRHRLADDFGLGVRRLREAHRLTVSHRTYKELFKAQFGVLHSILAMEATRGDVNGWHPHFHKLHYSTVKITEIPEALHRLWADSCQAVGLRRPDREHGLVLTHDADAYVAKWGFAEEVTGQAHKKSETALSLLARFADTGDRECARLFLEYVEATYGIHQLQFSRGAKADYGIAQVTDQQASHVSDEERESSILLRRISLPEWYLITKFRAQPALLDVMQEKGEPGIRELIEDLQRRNTRTFFS